MKDYIIELIQKTQDIELLDLILLILSEHGGQ